MTENERNIVRANTGSISGSSNVNPKTPKPQKYEKLNGIFD